MKGKPVEEVLEALTTVRVDMLDEEATRLFEVIMKVIDERDELNNRIEKATDKLQLLVDIGFDYDGMSKSEDLQLLIDDLVSYAKDSIKILNKKDDDKEYSAKEELESRIEKAIDTLYCWGEVLDADFQNKMLNILKGNDEKDI